MTLFEEEAERGMRQDAMLIRLAPGRVTLVPRAVTESVSATPSGARRARLTPTTTRDLSFFLGRSTPAASVI